MYDDMDEMSEEEKKAVADAKKLQKAEGYVNDLHQTRLLKIYPV
jgi:hypothetical protein